MENEDSGNEGSSPVKHNTEEQIRRRIVSARQKFIGKNRKLAKSGIEKAATDKFLNLKRRRRSSEDKERNNIIDFII